MGEFNEHYRQRSFRHIPLCAKCVSTLGLQDSFKMVYISGLGSECIWCGIYSCAHVEATFLVDREVTWA